MKNRELTIIARDAIVNDKEGVIVECTLTGAKTDFQKSLLIARVIQALERRYGAKVMGDAILMSMIATDE